MCVLRVLLLLNVRRYVKYLHPSQINIIHWSLSFAELSQMLDLIVGWYLVVGGVVG